MNPSQVDAVKTSFAMLAPMGTEVATLFYARLFELDPTLRRLFSDDIHPQSEKLMQTLTVVVNSLDRPDVILPAVKALDARHANYGVLEEHYDSVARALLGTLEQGLGPKFTPYVQDAWKAAYSLLVDVMKAAARDTATAQSQ